MEDRNYPVDKMFEVKTYEVDFAGIMSNQIYLRWAEDMRTAVLDQFVDIRDLIKEGKVPVVAHTEIDYKWPARLKDQVKGTMWVEELDGPKWALRGEFRIGGRVCARVYHFGVWVDTKTFRPTNPPEILPKV